MYGADETLQIIRSHYCQCVLPDSSPNDTKDEFAFDFDRVQNDVILSCVAGKPMIYSPSEHLRVVFPFKKHISDPILLDLADTDLSALTESIPSGFQVHKALLYLYDLVNAWHFPTFNHFEKHTLFALILYDFKDIL